MRHIIFISGKDSLATALVQMARAPHLPYEFVHNPTGMDYPEVLTWLERVEHVLGITLVRVGANLDDVLDYHHMLPSARVRFCTRMCKIEPVQKYVGKEPVTLYYGIRADEYRGGHIPDVGSQQTIVYPLQEMGMGINEVYALLQARNLLPPQFFWPQVHELTVHLLGDNAGWLDTLHPFAFGQLFSGRTRSNCFCCFNQRAYEWIWCHDTHPELFTRSIELEEEYGAWDYRENKEREKPYTWRSDGSLPTLLARADSIRLRRAKEIARYVAKAAGQPLLFDDLDVLNEPDMLAGTSCGLMCGK